MNLQKLQVLLELITLKKVDGDYDDDRRYKYYDSDNMFNKFNYNNNNCNINISNEMNDDEYCYNIEIKTYYFLCECYR